MMMNTFLLAELIPPGVDVPIILPELIVAFTGIVVMLYDSFFPKQKVATAAISLIGILISGFVLASMWGGGVPQSGWNGMMVTGLWRAAGATGSAAAAALARVVAEFLARDMGGVHRLREVIRRLVEQ